MKKKKFDKKKIIRIIEIVAVILVVFLIFFFGFYYPNKIFKDNEETFAAAGERYYQVNRNFIPSEEGRVMTVTLSTLVQENYLDDLLIPYSNKVCDVNDSTVKAVLKDGKYEYYTYLKCGKYESDTDHEGPVITLNGDTEQKVSRGSEYTDPGIKSVVDNTDGEMNVDDVTVKGEVDTSKVGTYKITYRIRDSLDNNTTVTRTVKVEERLSTVVKEATKDTNNYYKGQVDNNYLMFNNMLFRIVKVNNDNSVVIASNDALANVDYTNDGKFTDSSLDKWLNDYFYNLLEPRYQKLIKSSTWCDDKVNANNTSTTECTRQSAKRNVGILSLQDYNMTHDGTSSYLSKTNYTWYANIADDNSAWGITGVAAYPESLAVSDETNLLNVVPAVTLKASTSILDGDGSSTNPYIILEDKKGKSSSNLNEREVGEYVKYSGYTFRISNTLDDGTTEVIMDSTLTSNNRQVNISYENEQERKVYNPNQEGNIAYQIKNNMTRYIDTKFFVNKEITVPIYDGRITYEGKHDTKKYNLLITIPSTFDIFSARIGNTYDSGYWLIDSSKEAGIKAVVRSSGTVTYSNAPDTTTAGVKVKAYFGEDVVIKSGSGTIDDPYTLVS